MNSILQIEKEAMRLDLPHFGPGDTVKVHVKIKEGEKERIQVFQGVVISKRKGTTNDKIEVVTRGRVRRAKIYYLRKLRGKAARIKERRFN